MLDVRLLAFPDQASAVLRFLDRLARERSGRKGVLFKVIGYQCFGSGFGIAEVRAFAVKETGPTADEPLGIWHLDALVLLWLPLAIISRSCR